RKTRSELLYSNHNMDQVYTIQHLCDRCRYRREHFYATIFATTSGGQLRSYDLLARQIAFGLEQVNDIFRFANRRAISLQPLKRSIAVFRARRHDAIAWDPYVISAKKCIRGRRLYTDLRLHTRDHDGI